MLPYPDLLDTNFQSCYAREYPLTVLWALGNSEPVRLLRHLDDVRRSQEREAERNEGYSADRHVERGEDEQDRGDERQKARGVEIQRGSP